MNSAQNILLSILSEARNKNLPVGKTQLVKYLYLTEVEHYRETGSRLTDLDWKFYHYGPYAFELETILEEKIFKHEEIKISTEKSFNKFTVAEPTKHYNDLVDVKTSLIIKRIIGMWGDKPLQDLLDYVYFETEPMQVVDRRGQRLDFSTIKKDESSAIIPLKASKDAEKRIAVLRGRFSKRLSELSEIRPVGEPYTEEYKQALEAWEEEEKVEPRDISKIQVNITKQK
jgi:hypothetical protein